MRRLKDRDALLGRRRPSSAGTKLLDASIVQTEHPVSSALHLEISLKLIPCAEIFTALGAVDRRCGLSIGRNLQTDGAAKRALQFVIQILAGHDAQHRAIGTASQVRIST